jgi:hypothetical protein
MRAKRRRPKVKNLRFERTVFWSLFLCIAVGVLCWVLGTRYVGDDGLVRAGTTAWLLFMGAFGSIAAFCNILGSLVGGEEDDPYSKSGFLERRRSGRPRR